MLGTSPHSSPLHLILGNLTFTPDLHGASFQSRCLQDMYTTHHKVYRSTWLDTSQMSQDHRFSQMSHLNLLKHSHLLKSLPDDNRTIMY